MTSAFRIVMYNQLKQKTMGMFDFVNEEVEKQEQAKVTEVTNELPEAFQVLTTEKVGNGVHERIVDTFMVDRAKGIIPDEKAKKKAQAMKRVFPDKTYYVVGIYKRIEATY